MTQANVRISDRVVLQIGTSLGELLDPGTGKPLATELMELDEATAKALAAAFAQPHGNIYLAADGTVTADPFVPPAPTPVSIQQAADLQTCKDFVANPAPTSADVAAAMKADMRLRGLG